MSLPRRASSSETLSFGQVKPVSTEIDLPTLEVTKGLLALWEESLGLNDELPFFRDFSPEKLGKLAPFVYGLERTDFDDDFRVCFMGEAIIQSVGRDYSGETISIQSEHPSAWRVEIYRRVLERCAPVFTAVSLGDFERDNIKTECVLLPVLDGSGALNHVVCAAAPYPTVN